MISRCLLVLWSLSAVSLSFAQYRSVDRSGTISLQIVFAGGDGCPSEVQVQLSSGDGIPVGRNFTDEHCKVEFSGLSTGSYRLIVSGKGLKEVDSGVFEVSSQKATQSLVITVERNSDGAGNKSTTPTVAAADLSIPKSAAKEFDKATASIAKEDWDKARQQLLKALAIYPQYAAANNNLGVVYGRLGDHAQQRELLQKAIACNDHFAPAYVNLARLEIADRNFPEAEALLSKATAADPGNPQTLMMLANVELINRHYEQAIADCHKVHSLPHAAQALVHFIAARIFEAENRPADATSELRTFLTEEPTGTRADAVRKEMSSLENQLANK